MISEKLATTLSLTKGFHAWRLFLIANSSKLLMWSCFFWKLMIPQSGTPTFDGSVGKQCECEGYSVPNLTQVKLHWSHAQLGQNYKLLKGGHVTPRDRAVAKGLKGWNLASRNRKLLICFLVGKAWKVCEFVLIPRYVINSDGDRIDFLRFTRTLKFLVKWRRISPELRIPCGDLAKTC